MKMKNKTNNIAESERDNNGALNTKKVFPNFKGKYSEQNELGVFHMYDASFDQCNTS